MSADPPVPVHPRMPKSGPFASFLYFLPLAWHRLTGARDRYYQALLRLREARIARLERRWEQAERGWLHAVPLDAAGDAASPGGFAAPVRRQGWLLATRTPPAPAAHDLQPAPLPGGQPGEVAGFTASLSGEGTLRPGDSLAYGLPLEAASLWDPEFAAVIAGTVTVDDPGTVSAVFLGLGDADGLVYEVPAAWTGSAWYASGAWRFAGPPDSPFLQIRVVLTAAAKPVRLAAGPLFAGLRFDPYRFNPRFRDLAAAHAAHRPAAAADLLRAFEQEARRTVRAEPDAYSSGQSYVAPFVVVREGQPRFAMLIGNANALHWYAIDPRHGLELYESLQCIGPGEVTMDCGTHAGQMAVYFRLQAGPGGRVIAFDPFAQNCRHVAAQARLNGLDGIRVVEAGVGARRERLRVSMHHQQTVGAAGLRTDATEVEIVPLDDFVDERPTFLKIDVEGAEVDALKGAAQLLRACRPKLLVEVHTPFLAGFGYGLADLFAAIPADLYDVRFKVDGGDDDWRRYEPGAERGLTAPLLVYAVPRPDSQPPVTPAQV